MHNQVMLEKSLILRGRCTYLFHQVLSLLGNPAGVMGRVHADGLKQLILVISMEWRLSNEHLVQQDPK